MDSETVLTRPVCSHNRNALMQSVSSQNVVVSVYYDLTKAFDCFSFSSSSSEAFIFSLSPNYVTWFCISFTCRQVSFLVLGCFPRIHTPWSLLFFKALTSAPDRSTFSATVLAILLVTLPVSGLPKTSKSSFASVMWRPAKHFQSDIDSAHK
jgi:hypothetical protein